MKLLTLVIPCYNSAAYMERAIESALPCGEELDLILVDDGSTDATGEIADRYAARYPAIVRVVHQPNGGHGAGLNQGIRLGQGIYFKVLDSDDRLDPRYLPGLLDVLRDHSAPDRQLDLLIHDYVYDREEKQAVFGISYRDCLPPDRDLTWETVRHFPPWRQFMIHCMVYRLQLLRDMGLVLPEHIFYEDNLYIYRPLPYTKKLWYYPHPVHGYFIGRADQSVNDNVIIRRLDQVTSIATQMITSYRLEELDRLPRHLRGYMLSNLCGQLSTTCPIQYMAGEKGLEQNRAMWEAIRAFDPALYRALRRKPLGRVTCLPGRVGRGIIVFGFKTAHKIVKF